MDKKLLTEVDGAQELIRHFGRWPCFHDAEIVHLHLNRTGESVMRVHAFSMTDKVDASNHYVFEKHTLIDFHMLDVTDCDIGYFNLQNVIDDIVAEKTDEGIKLTIHEIWGLTGSISCRAVRISFQSGIPPGSVYAKS